MADSIQINSWQSVENLILRPPRRHARAVVPSWLLPAHLLTLATAAQ